MNLLLLIILVVVSPYMQTSLTFAQGSGSSSADSVRVQLTHLLNEGQRLFDAHTTTSYDSSLRVLDSARFLAESHFGAQDTTVANVLRLMAECHYWIGDARMADSLAKHAVQIWENRFGPDHPGIARNLRIVATVRHAKQNKFAEAEQLYMRVKDLLENAPSDYLEDKAELYFYLGDFYRRAVRYTESEAAFLESRDILKRIWGDENFQYAMTITALGFTYWYQKRYDESERILLEALGILERTAGPDHAWVAINLQGLDAVYREQGRLKESAKAIRREIRIVEKAWGRDHWLYSQYPWRLAYLEAVRGNWAAVVPLVKDALNAKGQWFTERKPRIQNLLAQALGVAGKSQECLAMFDEMLRGRRLILNDLLAHVSETQKMRFLSRNPFMEGALLSYALMHETDESKRIAGEMILKGKARVLEALAAEREIAFCSEDDRINQLTVQHKATCGQIASLTFSGYKQMTGPDVKDSLTTLYKLKDEIETILNLACEEFRSSRLTNRFTVGDVAAALPDSSLLLEYIVYRPYKFQNVPKDENLEPARYAVITLDSEGHTDIYRLAESDRVNTLVLKCREALRTATQKIYGGLESDLETSLAVITGELYSLIFAPLEKLLDGKDQIFISLDDQLSLLPFEILMTDNGRYLIEKYKISYLSSGRDLLKHRDNDEPSGVLAVIMADPDYDATSDPAISTALVSITNDGGSSLPVRGSSDEEKCLTDLFGPLFATATEGKAIADILASNTGLEIHDYYGHRASEDILKSIKQPPEILHLATHGYYCANATFSGSDMAENPLLYSGLALAGANRIIADYPFEDSEVSPAEDGILTSLEASGLNLVGTDLVVLSACQSGVGEIKGGGEGVYGLRRAFQHAGARSIVMSMFAIPDKSTVTLMERFYNNWLSGDSKSTALRNASLSILRERREQHGAAHPLFWGGFILVGDPD